VSSFLARAYAKAPGTETVRNELLNDSAPPTLTLDSDLPDVNQELLNLTVNVELSSEQVADEDLVNALLVFRHAANILAKQQDRIVLSGFDEAVPAQQADKFFANRAKLKKVRGLEGAAIQLPVFVQQPMPDKTLEPLGHALVREVVTAIQKLDDNSNPGPFACVLGNDLYAAAYNPNWTLVIPADRIMPLLNGPLVRSSGLAKNKGLVISQGANAVDIFVGTPPTVQFLQRNKEAKFLFRVYTRFALRIRDPKSIVRFIS
jgi:hypothetical protein